jgi:adenine-specific DNA methylase
MDKSYNFDALETMAQQNGFIGNSITTGFDGGLKIEIVSKDKIEKVNLNCRHQALEIRINGTDEYILVTCPPNSNFYIRLSMLISE